MGLRLSDVSAGYGQHIAVKNINQVFREGVSYGIIGPNGSGKTTLLRVISGLLGYEGSITLDASDREISDMKRKEIASHIALMPQLSGSYFSYTVRETVMLGRYVHTRRNGILQGESSEDRLKAEEVLSEMGLTEVQNRSLSELSGGQLQRVLLARTIAQDTDILLLDEPTNHLDLRYQCTLTGYLKKWMTPARTLIGVYHDIDVALDVSDELILLKEGQTLYSGIAAELIESELLNEAYDINVADVMRQHLSHWG